MAENTDELGAIVPPLAEHQARAAATEARGILQSETYRYACRKLTDEYLRIYLNLKPTDPGYAEQCMRIQIACNVVTDVTNQLGMLADFSKFDREAAAKTAKGTK
jgi:hypothetical protein